MNSSHTPGCVVTCAGHMIDSPSRPVPRFPASSEAKVRAAIRSCLTKWNAKVGVSALASGADILFVEEMLDRGGDVKIVLPLNEKTFCKESVLPAGADWAARFDRLLARIRTQHNPEIFGGEYVSGSGSPFQLAALLIDGIGQIEAQSRGLSSIALGIWDGKPGDGMGGTASFLGHSYKAARDCWAIRPISGDIFKVGSEALSAAQKHTWQTREIVGAEFEHRMSAFLFADAKGFGSLQEDQVPVFVERMLRVLRQALRESGVRPLAFNTWGDGVFLATEYPREAAEVALRLVKADAQRLSAEATSPTHSHSTQAGLASVQYRVGLHAGSAFYTRVDPVTGQPNVFGADVSTAARIEPVVTPGQVWASRTFVALAHATGTADLQFQDLGVIKLAKDAGQMWVYNVSK